MIKGMEHTGFVVNDLDKSVQFYRKVVGMKVHRRVERSGGPISQIVGHEDTHLKAVLLTIGDGPALELIQYLNPQPSARATEERSALGASHLAFVVDDIDQTYRTLIAGGARKLNTPVEVAPGRTVCYLQDPDGNWLELVEVKTPAR